MDSQPALSVGGAAASSRAGRPHQQAPCGDQTVTAEQVIFASLPGIMGRGYRIVAASAGVRAQEKAEINRRSPSHASMCDEDPQSVGLSAYPLATGRYAVACSTYGPVEYSARGGRRIDTRIALLDAGSYRRFDCNPLRVYRAVADAVGPEPITKAPTSLPRLVLALRSSRTGDAVTLPPCLDAATDDARMAYLGSILLAGERLIVRHVDAPLSLLEWAVLSIPISRRPGLTLSAGLKVSPSRPSHLAVLSRDAGETERAIAGHHVRVYDGNDPPPPYTSPYGDWLDLVRTWWAAGRFTDLTRLSSRLDAHADPHDLSRVVCLVRDLDRVRQADPSERAAIFDRYRGRVGATDLETDLIGRILAVTQSAAGTKGTSVREKAPAPAS